MDIVIARPPAGSRPARQIKAVERYRDIPIIASAGQSRPGRSAVGRCRRRCIDYVAKPIMLWQNRRETDPRPLRASPRA